MHNDRSHGFPGTLPVGEAAQLLSRSNYTICTAESCTGGLLGAALTGVSGSSAYYLGGVVTYADAVKMRLLDVDPGVIASKGAVSAETALQMAVGARRLFGADIAVSVTGVAGPTGGTPQKPVGTTFIALVVPGTERVEHFCWNGGRDENRWQSVSAALGMVRDYLLMAGSVPSRVAGEEDTPAR